MTSIAYCPTMEPYILKLQEQLPEINFIAMPSAGMVLSELKNHRIDGVIIGRPAYTYELDSNTKFVRFRKGKTLVYQTKIAIDDNKLKELKVITYLNREDIKDYLPLFKSIDYYSSLHACLSFNLEIPILIDFEDFSDNFQLLIPVNARGKNPMFRAPVLYHHQIDDGLVEKMSALLDFD